jgi:hypothetical protein
MEMTGSSVDAESEAGMMVVGGKSENAFVAVVHHPMAAYVLTIG